MYVVYETFDELSARAKRAMYNYSVTEIHKTMESMSRRIYWIIGCESERTKYWSFNKYKNTSTRIAYFSRRFEATLSNT